SVHKTYLIEQDAHNVIIESVDMHYDSKQIDQNDEDVDLAKEQMELACAKVREMKNKLFAHQDTISILKQQKNAQIKLYKSRKDKEIEKVIDLENKVKKTQFVNEIDRLSKEYYYADHMNAIFGVYTELDKVTNLQYFSKSTSVTQNNVSNDLSKPVTAQTLPSNMKYILKNTNVLAPRTYKLHTDHTQARTYKLPQDSKKTNKRVSFSTGVIPITSVSIPHLKSNPMRDKVMHNNSQGKKKAVEDHRRSVKLSKNKTSVTACNDSLNAETLNVKFDYAMCDKCVLIDKHDMCALTSVAEPIKKTVASESNKKPINFTRKLYERLIEIVLFIVDSGCSKHMTGNLKLLINFVEIFLGTVKFRNDQIAPILGYGDLLQGAVTITRVYYVKGLNHNLFSVGQFCDADLEVA
nr:integrase, catalytic region, zinc finger, CCHC-type, peptidase aspartic, catalytic [Tanacetum cinerariifolium]